MTNPRIRRSLALLIARDAISEGRPECVPGIMAQAPREWHAETNAKDPSAIDIGEGWSSYGQLKITMINPTCKREGVNRYHREAGAYVFEFGAYGCTALHCYASSFEDALEQCAGWLADHAPGHIMADGSPEMDDLYADAARELGIADWRSVDASSDEASKIYESATTDLTYTESGYLTSHEWTGSKVDSVEDLYRMIKGGDY